MNLDMNTISTLMQLFSQKNDGDIAQTMSQKPSDAQSTHVCAQNDKSIEMPAFVRQNGIGEQIRLDFSKKENQSDTKSDLLKNLSSQNPMLALLGNMQNGKADMASMLPLVMSLMQKPKADGKANQNADAPNSTDNVNSKDNTEKENCNIRPNESSPLNKEKPQREIFSPVAFAGYEIISSLYCLLKASRRPCR